jgi:mono/diheme cytochrome c family protein
MMLALAGCAALTMGTLSWSAEKKETAATEAADWDSEEDLFLSACAACHGADGTGRPQEVVGFDTPLPDFTDCSFATREPDSDWFAIAHDGGPARGFSHVMPAFGEALSDDEIQMALNHLRSFCDEKKWPRGELNLPRPMFTEKAFVEDEAVLTFWASTELPMAVMAEFIYEKRFGPRSQVEVVVPFGVAQDEKEDGSRPWVAGLGDIALALKQMLVGNVKTGSVMSLITELVLPTGRTRGDIGEGKVKIEPSFVFGQILGPAGFLQMQAGLEIPAESKPSVEALWGVVYGYSFTQGRFGRSWTPMVEVLGKSDLEEDATVHWDIAPQLQISLSTRQHMLLNLATRIPLEPGNDRPVEVFVYLLWDWFDGGFLEGW